MPRPNIIVALVLPPTGEGLFLLKFKVNIKHTSSCLGTGDKSIGSGKVTLVSSYKYEKYMLEFFIDNIFVQFGGLVFQQTIGIPMGTNCAPLLADLFPRSYEAVYLQGLVKKQEEHWLSPSITALDI